MARQTNRASSGCRGSRAYSAQRGMRRNSLGVAGHVEVGGEHRGEQRDQPSARPSGGCGARSTPSPPAISATPLTVTTRAGVHPVAEAGRHDAAVGAGYREVVDAGPDEKQRRAARGDRAPSRVHRAPHLKRSANARSSPAAAGGRAARARWARRRRGCPRPASSRSPCRVTISGTGLERVGGVGRAVGLEHVLGVAVVGGDDAGAAARRVPRARPLRGTRRRSRPRAPRRGSRRCGRPCRRWRS